MKTKSILYLFAAAALTACTNVLGEPVAGSGMTRAAGSGQALGQTDRFGDLFACVEYTEDENPGMTGVNACTDVCTYIYVDTVRLVLFQGKHDRTTVYRITEYAYGTASADMEHFSGATPADALVEYRISAATLTGSTLLAVCEPDTVRTFTRIRRGFDINQVAERYFELSIAPGVTPWAAE